MIELYSILYRRKSAEFSCSKWLYHSNLSIT